MKAVVCAVFVGLFSLTVAENFSPKVQVYSRRPGEFGKPNHIVCHVSNFHPPEIRVELLNNGKPLLNAVQSDLAFESNWHYHLTKHAPFTPSKGDHFTCQVTHMDNIKSYIWEPDM